MVRESYGPLLHICKRGIGIFGREVIQRGICERERSCFLRLWEGAEYGKGARVFF